MTCPAPSGWLPLTAAQTGIWYAQARDPRSPTLVTGQALHIRGSLDGDALAQALDALGTEAEALSLRFRAGPDGPRQRVSGDAPRLRPIDCTGDSAEMVMARILAEARQPMDLIAGPVADFALWQLAPDHHILSERIHHIAVDGSAMVHLTRRLAAIYNGEGGAPLTPYARSIEEDARFATSEARTRQRAYWLEQAVTLPPVESIARSGLADGDGRWFHRTEQHLPPAALTGLRALSDRADLHWTDVLTALTGAYVARHMPLVVAGDSTDVVLGVPLQNRFGRIARTVSTQVNVLPLHLSVTEDTPLTDWLAEAADRLTTLRRNSAYRGEAIARETGRIGAGRRLWGPLVNVMPFDACPQIDGCETRLEITGAGSVDDITFCYRGDPENGLLLQVDGNDALYEAGEIQRHCNRLAEFLTRAAQAPTLAEVPTLTPIEAAQALTSRNATAHPVPRTTLTALIEAQMRATPDATALTMGKGTLTYAELNTRSAALAGGLAARGIGAGDLVAVALPRSFDLVVALVGILRAGAAYVPLDPEDRSARRAHMITVAAPKLILGLPDFDAGLPDAPPLAQVAHVSGDACPAPPQPDDLAYVLFTSGSTGAPKGVEITHDAIVNRLLWMHEAYGFSPADRTLQKTPATFDVSVWEFFLPLLSGGTLVLAPPNAHRDPVALAALVRDHAITAMHFVPSMLELFLASPASADLHIPRVFASGEALPQRLANAFHDRIRGALHNLYGPTEAAVDVTAWQARPAVADGTVPIGQPVWNTRCMVLDARDRLVPDHVPGRLFLAGRQLARGYKGRPDLTAERFRPDPFASAERMYDTGDVVISDASGVLSFQGRADGQVKIRGVRIELAEVEAALLNGLCRQAVVSVQSGHGGQARLVAHVVSDQPANAIRQALGERLPPSMIPAHVVVMDALPLTPSGKLDRKALPAPGLDQSPVQTGPMTPTENLLARLFAEILGMAHPAPDTDFFLAGGDSLGAVRLCLAIEEATGTDPGLGSILETPVLADLAQRLDRTQAPDQGLGPVLHLRQGAGTPLFAIHPAGGLAWCYRMLAQRLDRPVIGLQSPLLDPSANTPASLTDLAQDYMNRIDRIAPTGPIALLGWSLGGIIAHSISAEAEARGRNIGQLVLLDAYPSDCWRDQPEPDPVAALRALLAIAGFDPEAHLDLTTAEAIMGFLAAQGHPLALLPDAVQQGIIRSVRATNALVRGHREPQISAPLLHVTALRDQIGSGRAASQWAPYAGGVETLALDCHHADLIHPDQVARIIPHLP